MKTRVITSLALAPAVLVVCALATPYPLFCVCLTSATVGFMELRSLLASRNALPVLTLIGVALPFIGTEVQTNIIAAKVLVLAATFMCLGVLFAWLAARRSQVSTAEVDLAGLWISMPLSCIVLMHNRLFWPASFEHATFVPTPVLCLLIPVWVSDIAAMLVGKKWGRHLLWPKVSPKKTIEGSMAGLSGALVACGAYWPLLAGPKPGPWWVCGLAVGILGQVGDLFESYVKRLAGVKESGSILPGHGGLLDRIDSLLFATPAVALLLVFWPRP